MKVKMGGKNLKSSKDLSSESEADHEDSGMKEEQEGVTKPKNYSTSSEFSTYIARVKKQVHPSLGITKSSMKIMESFIEDFFDRICRESGQLMRSSGNKTLKAQDVLAAIKVILPGEIRTHAVAEAEKALEAYREVVAE